MLIEEDHRLAQPTRLHVSQIYFIDSKMMPPTQHVIYFGIQAKKANLDTAGMTKSSDASIAEICNQILAIPGHDFRRPCSR